MAIPHRLDIPGENLPHVDHYFKHPHHYFRQRLLVVGGRNSAVEAAIRAWRAGAQVALSYRRAELDEDHIYSRLHLEINLLIRKGRIAYYPETQPVEIRPGETVLGGGAASAGAGGVGSDGGAGGERTVVAADFVYLATGYEADTSVLEALGVDFEAGGNAPVFDEETMETTEPGVYIAGTAVGGNTEGYQVFVGTCHDQAVKILSHAFGIRDAGSIITGTVKNRNYPFGRKDIEPE
jgi:thioredoxin reductase (NADPH)